MMVLGNDKPLEFKWVNIIVVALMLKGVECCYE
jgi:hypothetical protein